jgi:cytochrome c
MRPSLTQRLLASLAVLLAATPALASDGGEAFRTNCASCHRLDGVSTRSGPSLNGVVWRKIAVLPHFAYSRALRSMVGTWSPARLNAFLRNTQAVAPGTDMFWDIEDATTRRDIIEYLKSTK